MYVVQTYWYVKYTGGVCDVYVWVYGTYIRVCVVYTYGHTRIGVYTSILVCVCA